MLVFRKFETSPNKCGAEMQKEKLKSADKRIKPKMKTQNPYDAMREKLLIAGIRELEEHGLNDFSLRRVASACEISCAAPYRHFKSKEDLIIGIIAYINKQWLLLAEQIAAAYADNPKKRLTEIGVSHIRFWIANPNFRSVLLMEDHDPNSQRLAERKKISDSIEKEIHLYCESVGIKNPKEKTVSMAFRSLIYGSVLLLGNGEVENSEKTVSEIRKAFDKILK